MSKLNKLISKSNQNLDLPQTTIQRSKIIKRKYFLHEVYKYYYKILYHALTDKNKKGQIIELGSGGGFIKKFIPHAITSDILKLPKIDMQFSALDMPFKAKSVNAFVMIDVFHHINDVEKFLSEANRCLKKNGQIIMIEPASTPFGKFIYKFFHHEPYVAHAPWHFATTGPLSGANSALPWIVFIRDKKKFKKKYPTLKVEKLEAHTPFRYLLSGGFTVRQLLPNSFYPIIVRLEKLLSPYNHYLGMFYTICITKEK